MVVEMKNAAQRDSRAQKPGLRCPACFLVQGFTVKDFTCTLTVGALASLSAPLIHPPGCSQPVCASSARRLKN